MKYYVFDSDEGYQEFDELEKAAEAFQRMPIDGNYSAIGITKGITAIDVIFRKDDNGESVQKTSGDFRSSIWFNNHRNDVTDELRKIHKTLKMPETALNQFLNKDESLTQEALVDELEMM